MGKSQKLIDTVDFDALEVIIAKYKPYMDDIDVKATEYIFSKYSALEGLRERLRDLWGVVGSYPQGSEENKKAFEEYKRLSDELKSKTKKV